MCKGNIIWMCSFKKYGFINPCGESAMDREGNIFVHENHVLPGNKLTAGDLVTYDLMRGDQGLIAVNVQLAKGGV